MNSMRDTRRCFSQAARTTTFGWIFRKLLRRIRTTPASVRRKHPETFVLRRFVPEKLVQLRQTPGQAVGNNYLNTPWNRRTAPNPKLGKVTHATSAPMTMTMTMTMTMNMNRKMNMASTRSTIISPHLSPGV